jgi:hypothetical protein
VNYLSVFLALSILTFAAERPVFRNSAPLDQFVHDAAVVQEFSQTAPEAGLVLLNRRIWTGNGIPRRVVH